MKRSLVFSLGPVLVELADTRQIEAYDLEALEPYQSARPADFAVDLANEPLPECGGLARDSSALSPDGNVLLMRYASWVVGIDMKKRTARAYLPNRSLFDNFLRTMAQVVPLVTGAGMAMHAASLEFEGRAVALAAPSTTGKSTAAVRALSAGASVLAEDVTIIGGFAEGCPRVYTSPLRNHCGVVAGPLAVPLSRVYRLRRAPVDRVVRLTPYEAMGVLRENVAIGTRQPSLALAALRFGQMLVDTVGVRALECSMDGPFWDAVRQDLAADRTDVLEVT
jgi:hypothetical protein